jgi:hypothetical protein
MCHSVEGVAPLLAELGFPTGPVPLTAEGAASLDLPESVGDVRVSAADGALRALVFSSQSEDELRNTIGRVALNLSTRASQLLFLLVAIDWRKRRVGFAVFDSTRPRPRVSGLVVEIDRIVDSDAEAICALSAAQSGSSVLTHARWIEILGRESINRRFFRELERVVVNLAKSLLPCVNESEARELSLLCISRLLFLSFLETKGWLDGDHGFLANRFADCMVHGGSYHRRVLNPLFFGTLNTPPKHRATRARDFGRVPFLNGGLFARARLEGVYAKTFFSDESLGDAFGDLLSRYRFTAREDGTAWTEAAIDPEMLGKAFESLMSATDRKKSGAFYTPHAMVREVCRSALSYGLSSRCVPHETVSAAFDGNIPGTSEREAILENIGTARVLDPACGSGAFLVHALEELASLRVRLGDLRSPHAVRREILTRSIFGVDINPVAAWLCELRLWLSMAIEDPEPDPFRVTPLPNLDRNIRTGDSLSGDGFNDRLPRIEGNRIAVARSRYTRATGPRKRTLGRALDSMERACALTLFEKRVARLTHERKDLLTMLRSPDLFGERNPPGPESRDALQRLRRELTQLRTAIRKLRDGGSLPFSFASGFGDAAADGGFRIVLGNPPWIRTGNLDSLERAELRERFSVFRNSSWAAGASLAAAGKGFASQADAAALFVERCSDLVQPEGTIALVLPSKLWRSLAGGGVRSLIAERMTLREIHDLTAAPSLFDAAVYPSVITATRGSTNRANPIAILSHGGDQVVRSCIEKSRLAFDDSPGSPWIIVPDEVRNAFDALSRCGIPMAEGPIGRPMLGVKTGCNDAFLVSTDADVEPSMLRPVIRGERVRAWSIPAVDERIIWTHDESGPLRSLPSRTSHRLSKWRNALERRTDGRGRHRWWMLFRTESASSSHPRVVWSDIGKSPRAAVIPAGKNSVPLNTCYVARCRDLTDAYALTALLNSTLLAAWIALLAEPARGGYLRFMGWTMSLVPLPKDWQRTRREIAPIAECAVQGRVPSEDDLLDKVLCAYGLVRKDVHALLEWSR